MIDHYSNDVETAAVLARHEAFEGLDRPDPTEYEDRPGQMTEPVESESAT